MFVYFSRHANFLVTSLTNYFLSEIFISLYRFVFRLATNYFSYLPSRALNYDTLKIILNADVTNYFSCLLRRALKNVSKNSYLYSNNLSGVG